MAKDPVYTYDFLYKPKNRCFLPSLGLGAVTGALFGTIKYYRGGPRAVGLSPRGRYATQWAVVSGCAVALAVMFACERNRKTQKSRAEFFLQNQKLIKEISESEGIINPTPLSSASSDEVKVERTGKLAVVSKAS